MSRAALGRVIEDVCTQMAVPLSVAQLYDVLDGFVERDLLEAACAELVRCGRLQALRRDVFHVPKWRTCAHRNLLVSREYQTLGMTVLRVDDDVYVRYVPRAAEHRFLEVRPSSIGRAAGMGLFVRRGRLVPQGCVLCEYTGRRVAEPPGDPSGGAYMVRVKSTAEYIDGRGADGENLSLATFINDDGPARANVGMVEYQSHPGRVFMVAHRDIHPGEEVLVLYGASYWGLDSYRARPPTAAPGRKRRREKGDDGDEPADATAGERTELCQGCGERYLARAGQLHREACGDAATQIRPLNLRCTPRSRLTYMSAGERVLPRARRHALRTSTSLVSLSHPQTFSHSCEDIVRDLEFSFEDVE